MLIGRCRPERNHFHQYSLFSILRVTGSGFSFLYSVALYCERIANFNQNPLIILTTMFMFAVDACDSYLH